MTTAHLCEALLQGGYLIPDDWDGSLVTSLQNGLSRWVATFGTFRYFDLALNYTDAAEQQFNLHAHSWEAEVEDEMEVPADEEIGCFSLHAVSLPSVDIGLPVMALENVSPGLGFAMLGLLREALSWCVQGFGPDYAARVARFTLWSEPIFDAHDDVIGFVDDDHLDPRENPEGRAKAEASQIERCQEFYDNIPRRATEPVWAPFVFQTLIRSGKCPEHLIPLLRCAHDLTEHVYSRSNVNAANHTGLMQEIEDTFAIMVRWSPDDMMPHILDMLHDDEMNTGTGSDVCFLVPFYATLPLTVHRAMRAIEVALHLTRQIDMLLRIWLPITEANYRPVYHPVDFDPNQLTFEFL